MSVSGCATPTKRRWKGCGFGEGLHIRHGKPFACFWWIKRFPGLNEAFQTGTRFGVRRRRKGSVRSHSLCEWKVGEMYEWGTRKVVGRPLGLRQRLLNVEKGGHIVFPTLM
jgi:hypothetical protein